MKKIIITVYILALTIKGMQGQSFFIDNKSKSSVETKGDTGAEAEKLFHIYTIASLSTTDELVKSISGTQKFAVLANVIPKKDDNVGLDLFFSINALNLRPKGIPADSLDLVSLMFPESGNSGFVFSPQLHWATFGKKKRHNLYSEASFSFRQTKVTRMVDDIDSGFSFAILNYNIMPVIYTFDYDAEDFRGNIMCGPYINFFNVPNEDAENFNSLNKNDVIFATPKKSFIYSLGAKFQLNINGFLFFIDLRNNYTPDLKNDNPYKGFVFNTGFNTSLKVFSR